ncbi:hypothetical protein MNB_SUP05-SYMBIONT-4-730 [hydrothermal vent metagenome]|uniref:Uncharacterized protein n=1 Tax=hydrothermal vent metagenome TaxID=652676 RepID=A0A1W1E049_9ZZZZ
MFLPPRGLLGVARKVFKLMKGGVLMIIHIYPHKVQRSQGVRN